MKNKLPVMWRANSKACITHQVDARSFCFKCEEYLQEKGLPLKCLLLLDNAPTHPPGLEEDTGKECDFIHAKYLPPYTTPILQPIDHHVILNCTLKACFESVLILQMTLN